MDDSAGVYVSHHQVLVSTGGAVGDLGLHAARDDLLSLTGECVLTVLTGVHSAEVEVRVRVGGVAPVDGLAGWQVAGEATLWCPEGRVTVCGLFGDCPPELSDIAVPGPGLVRVQVRGRNLSHVDDPAEGEPPEEYEVHVWPVAEDTAPCTLDPAGDPPRPWPPSRPAAAEWAVVRMVTRANPSSEQRVITRHVLRGAAAPEPPRVDLRRGRRGPTDLLSDLLARPADLLGAATDGDDLLLPVGDLAVRLHPLSSAADARVFRWTWEPAARPVLPQPMTDLPDAAPTEVELRLDPDAGLTVHHRRVRGPDAVLLGLLWDHLLDRTAHLADDGVAPPHPWEAAFATMAAAAGAEIEYSPRIQQQALDRLWGGRAPSERVRALPVDGVALARIDRPLLDALERADPRTQRAVARWAVDRCARAAGLSGLDWVEPALEAVAADAPLPPPFDHLPAAYARMLTDPQVPRALVTLLDGSTTVPRAATFLTTVQALSREDPLAGAVEAVLAAATAHGDGHPLLLAALRAAFPSLG